MNPKLEGGLEPGLRPARARQGACRTIAGDKDAAPVRLENTNMTEVAKLLLTALYEASEAA